jgi:ketosteroid isomerase-like protein
MKHRLPLPALPTLALLLALASFSVRVHAADDSRAAAVRAADDERVAATIAADRARLTAILSDDLRYAHSTGAVDTKASYVDSIVSKRTQYHSLEYVERNFSFPSPGIALMTGKVHVKTTSANGEMDAVLSFLSVWREEQGHWRFLAWQSARMPAAATK